MNNSFGVFADMGKKAKAAGARKVCAGGLQGCAAAFSEAMA